MKRLLVRVQGASRAKLIGYIVVSAGSGPVKCKRTECRGLRLHATGQARAHLAMTDHGLSVTSTLGEYCTSLSSLTCLVIQLRKGSNPGSPFVLLTPPFTYPAFGAGLAGLWLMQKTPNQVLPLRGAASFRRPS